MPFRWAQYLLPVPCQAPLATLCSLPHLSSLLLLRSLNRRGGGRPPPHAGRAPPRHSCYVLVLMTGTRPDAVSRLSRSSLTAQADINAFSKLNASFHELDDELKVSKVRQPHPQNAAHSSDTATATRILQRASGLSRSIQGRFPLPRAVSSPGSGLRPSVAASPPCGLGDLEENSSLSCRLTLLSWQGTKEVLLGAILISESLWRRRNSRICRMLKTR